MSRLPEEEAVRNKQIVQELLKLPHNRVCADCEAKDPRWASASLGSFICIRCAGIHRNLGVHISFVRSATLDEWATKHTKNMVKWGNDRVNAYFEANVPDNYYIPDEHDGVSAVERWIRDKYEHRRFVDSETPPPSNQLEKLKQMKNGKNTKKPKKKSNKDTPSKSTLTSSAQKKTPDARAQSLPAPQSSKISNTTKMNSKVTDDFDLLGVFDSVATAPSTPNPNALDVSTKLSSMSIKSSNLSNKPSSSKSAPAADDEFDLLGSASATSSTGLSNPASRNLNSAPSTVNPGHSGYPMGQPLYPSNNSYGMPQFGYSGQTMTPGSFNGAPAGYSGPMSGMAPPMHTGMPAPPPQQPY